jgi:hypothetical protein
VSPRGAPGVAVAKRRGARRHATAGRSRRSHHHARVVARGSSMPNERGSSRCRDPLRRRSRERRMANIPAQRSLKDPNQRLLESPVDTGRSTGAQVAGRAKLRDPPPRYDAAMEGHRGVVEIGCVPSREPNSPTESVRVPLRTSPTTLTTTSPTPMRRWELLSDDRTRSVWQMDRPASRRDRDAARSCPPAPPRLGVYLRVAGGQRHNHARAVCTSSSSPISRDAS